MATADIRFSTLVKKNVTAETPQLDRLSMSYEAYQDWADEETHAEWVQGEVIVFMLPKDIHQTTLGFLYYLLKSLIDAMDLGRVWVAPFEIKFSEGDSYREPDIFFVAKEHLDRLTEHRLEGSPDLIVEIVSASIVRNDRDDKFKEYQAADVREYWIIDPRLVSSEPIFTVLMIRAVILYSPQKMMRGSSCTCCRDFG